MSVRTTTRKGSFYPSGKLCCWFTWFNECLIAFWLYLIAIQLHLAAIRLHSIYENPAFAIFLFFSCYLLAWINNKWIRLDFSAEPKSLIAIKTIVKCNRIIIGYNWILLEHDRIAIEYNNPVSYTHLTLPTIYSV